MSTDIQTPYAQALVHLLKGTVYTEQEKTWEQVIEYQQEIQKYFSTIGLALHLYESEGYAFLKQHEAEEYGNFPKLLESRALPYNVSLLCVLLRKRMLEEEQKDILSVAVITEEQIVQEMMGVLPSKNNDAKVRTSILTTINKVVKMGFLKEMKGHKVTYGIQRILKAKIGAGEVNELLEKMKKHADAK